MKLTQKIRLFPTPEQEEVLWKLSEKCRLIYNFALAERREAYRHGTKGVNYRKQQNDLPMIKEHFPEYKWVYSKVLQCALRALAADYQSFFAFRKNGHADACPPNFEGSSQVLKLPRSFGYLFGVIFQDFLKDYLKMVEGVSVEYYNENHLLTIDIEGCKFCPVNTKFKVEKKLGAVCPLGGLLRGALKNIESKIKSFRWKNTEKPPVTIGSCTTSYEIVIE